MSIPARFPLGVLVALGMAFLLAHGCGDDDEGSSNRPGNPPATTIIGGGTGGEGGGEDQNICECMAQRQAEEATSGPCFQCMNTAFSQCATPAGACADSPGCVAINECVGQTCSSIECAMQCFLPFDKDDPHQLYEKHIGCICNMCRDKCAYSGSLTCELPDLDAGTTEGGSVTNSCACMLELIAGVPECVSCKEAALGPGGVCTPLADACAVDASCAYIWDCLDQSPCTTGKCIEDCKNAQSPAAAAKYDAYATCICTQCSGATACNAAGACP